MQSVRRTDSAVAIVFVVSSDLLVRTRCQPKQKVAARPTRTHGRVVERDRSADAKWLAAVGSGAGHLQATIDSGVSDIARALTTVGGRGWRARGPLTDVNNHLVLVIWQNQLSCTTRR